MIIHNSEELESYGEQLGNKLKGGEVIELIGDVGAGKTTFVRGLARGLAIDDPITSPSFTINCNYTGRDGILLRHYDFYRLNDAGIMQMELAEASSDQTAVVVVEWADSVKDVLPTEHIVIKINYLPTDGRSIQMIVPKTYNYLISQLNIDLILIDDYTRQRQ